MVPVQDAPIELRPSQLAVNRDHQLDAHAGYLARDGLSTPLAARPLVDVSAVRAPFWRRHSMRSMGLTRSVAGTGPTLTASIVKRSEAPLASALARVPRLQ